MAVAAAGRGSACVPHAAYGCTTICIVRWRFLFVVPCLTLCLVLPAADV